MIVIKTCHTNTGKDNNNKKETPKYSTKHLNNIYDKEIVTVTVGKNCLLLKLAIGTPLE